MRALIYDWSESKGNIFRSDIHDTFKKLGIEFDSFLLDFDDTNHLDYDEVENYFKDDDISVYDFIFSINYFPEISEFAKKNNIKYLSWSYDCPFNLRDIEDTLGNSCNYVFCFDGNQAAGYQALGYDNVFHLPLGINVDRYKRIKPSAHERKKFGGDIAFIGSLYEGQYPDIADISTEYAKGYMEAVINSQQLLYGAYILNDAVTPQLIEGMNEHFLELDPTTKFQIDKAGLVHILDQETSRRERLLLLNLLGSRFDMHFYSGQSYPMLRGVKCHDRVDYMREMPYVFASSKINLNISVKGIQTGMPLRTLDVMASGGFLLSNYQSELVEYFDYGNEVLVYESMEDAVVKCQYYLEHDELRAQIAQNGRNRVFAEHNLVDKIKAMLEVAGV